MTDIVSELRAWPARGDGSDGMSAHTVGGIMEKAAVEIERLRAELDKATANATEARNALALRYGNPL